MANRHLRGLSRTRRLRQETTRRHPLKLTARQQAEVIEALREEYDLLCRGEPDGHAVETALRIAEAAL
ncbi:MULTISPECIES: hypothetical protein [Brevundimonas]|uniref:Uncharacterized protein n=1 Tax=Brevundimonas vesicularis TaxID=41276 RepID=A0A1Z3U534_BREVE|nr:MULTISPECIES: hypothetical protein [Brevundimonas]ASE38397.1 hypothetical protein CEP68_02135 [Brevundimonas vesicularis]